MRRHRVLLFLALCLAPAVSQAGPPGSADPEQLTEKAPGKPGVDGTSPYTEKQVDDFMGRAVEVSFIVLVLIALDSGWKRFRRG
jgi:hypothetical protein